MGRLQRMNKVGLVLLILLVLLGVGITHVGAESQVGTLEITGVPQEVTAGRYDRQMGLFYADVSEIDGALIQVSFEEVQIVGQQMEWRTEDNYVTFGKRAKLTKDDFELTGDTVEYYGDQ